MKAKKTTLPNGVRVLTVPFQNLESVTVTIWAGVGSRHETSDISGISHFLEHMVFKGSKKRPTAREIAEEVDALGAEFNASTSKEYTNFYIKSRAGVIDIAFDVLSDMVLNPFLREEDIEKEKGVIVEEIGMYEDSPRLHVSTLFERLIFKGNDLGRDIIGTRESVRAVNRKKFESYRKKHYKSESIIITVAGGFDEKHALSLAKKYFGNLKPSGGKSYEERTPKTKLKQKGPQVLLSSQKREQANFILGFTGDKRANKDRYVEALLSSILGGGMSSRLFTEIREKRGLAYSVRSDVEGFVDTGYVQVYAGVDPKRIDEALKVTLDQAYGLATGKYPITDEELKKAKEYIKGHLALALEDTSFINHFFGEEELILGKTRTPEDVYEAIDKVTKEEVIRVAKLRFKKENLNLAIIGPYKDKAKFVKIVNS